MNEPDKMKQTNSRRKWTSFGYSVLGCILILGIWQLAATIVRSSLIVPDPVSVFLELFSYGGDPLFWLRVWGTVGRVLGGFGISLIFSLFFGISAGVWLPVRGILRPIIVFMQAVPVLSIILILLIWFGNEQVPLVTPILMTFPVMTEAVIQGVSGVDTKLLDMAKIYSVGFSRRLRGILVPSFLPGLFSGASASLGLTWKVVVAAEVLAQPLMGIGTQMQRAKNILETQEVFAWTLVAVVFSGITQGIFTLAARHWRTHGRRM